MAEATICCATGCQFSNSARKFNAFISSNCVVRKILTDFAWVRRKLTVPKRCWQAPCSEAVKRRIEQHTECVGCSWIYLTYGHRKVNTSQSRAVVND